MLTHLLYNQMFEDATWILTDKNGVSTEYDTRQMEAHVVSAYGAYHKDRYSEDSFYAEPEMEKGAVSVRYLHLGGCVIFSHQQNSSEFISYTQIFPKYEIDCYGYRYQCPECDHLTDELKPKEGGVPDFAFCFNCLIAVRVG